MAEAEMDLWRSSSKGSLKGHPEQVAQDQVQTAFEDL